MSSCKCDKCPAKDTPKCPKKELVDRAYYFQQLNNKKGTQK